MPAEYAQYAQELSTVMAAFRRHFCRPNGNRPIPLAHRHMRLWQWVFDLRRGRPQNAFVSIWPRGGGKSTSVELALAHVARRRTRSYALYVSETQLQADTHVGNVGGMLGEAGVERQVTKYGQSRAWRRNRLIAEGFAIDAYGLDAASRGAKIDDVRPDLIVLDDVDGAHDSPQVIARKIHTITHSLLPAGATSLAVLAVQNLPNRNGVFARLADGRAEWLTDRIVSGPFPAIEGLEVQRVPQADGPTQWRITGGTATWAGQSLDDCQRQINTFGLAAFRAESQHEAQGKGGLFRRDWFRIVDTFPHEAYRIRFWDMAGRRDRPGRDPGDPDYAVGILMAARQGQFWIVDVQRIRGTPLEVETRVQQTAAVDSRRVPVYLEQEGGSAGEFVIDAFQRRVLPGYSVHPVKPVQAKEIRAQPFASACEAGNVFLLHGAWNRGFLDEIDTVFGGGAPHDDQADAASGAHEVLAAGEYSRISADDYRPIEGARRPFADRGFDARSNDPTGRQLDIPPSKRRGARERW